MTECCIALGNSVQQNLAKESWGHPQLIYTASTYAGGASTLVEGLPSRKKDELP